MSYQLFKPMLYKYLVIAAQDCVIWSTVEDVYPKYWERRLQNTLYLAQTAGLSFDEIRTALQVGEYRAQSGM